MPTNTPEAEKIKLTEMPSKKLMCPIHETKVDEKNGGIKIKKHSIKIKELVSLKIKCEEVTISKSGDINKKPKIKKQFICYICSSPLNF